MGGFYYYANYKNWQFSYIPTEQLARKYKQQKNPIRSSNEKIVKLENKF